LLDFLYKRRERDPPGYEYFSEEVKSFHITEDFDENPLNSPSPLTREGRGGGDEGDWLKTGAGPVFLKIPPLPWGRG
jgi:hypothetical protein